jgi:uncharacterized SAM-binding protein YcdF (DUF218 family)
VILDFVKQQCHLSSPLLLAVLLAAGAVSLWRRPSSALARRYVLGLALGYWFVATRVGAVVLLSVLSYGVRPIATRQEAASTDTVVLLSGGVYTASVGDEVGGAPTASSLLRALEAARVVKLIDARRVIASGGRAVRDQLRSESELLRDALVAIGIARSAIIEESRSKNTREQALFVGALLRELKVRRFVLVTSPSHMRRSLALFRAEGFDPIASTSPLRSERTEPPPVLMPNGESLAISDDAVYEYAALAYYWLRGWL